MMAIILDLTPPERTSQRSVISCWHALKTAVEMLSLHVLLLAHAELLAVRPVALQPGTRASLALQLHRASPQMSGYVRGDDGGAPIDESLVRELIAARTSLRKARNFQAADNVRDDLQRMGVTLWDRDRVWMVGDAPPPSGGRDDGRPGRRGDSGQGVGRGADK